VHGLLAEAREEVLQVVRQGLRLSRALLLVRLEGVGGGKIRYMLFTEVISDLDVGVEHIFISAVLRGEQLHHPAYVGPQLPVHAGE
jgi:hypothetical protein